MSKLGREGPLRLSRDRLRQSGVIGNTSLQTLDPQPLDPSPQSQLLHHIRRTPILMDTEEQSHFSSRPGQAWLQVGPSSDGFNAGGRGTSILSPSFICLIKQCLSSF